MTELLQLLWFGRADWGRQWYLGFVIGDVFLGVIAALTNALQQARPESHAAGYWYVFLGIGLLGTIWFNVLEVRRQHYHTVLQLVTTPSLFWHNVVLFAMLIPLMTGTALPLMWHNRTNGLSWAIVACFAIYLALNVYDSYHPPLPASPIRPHSVEAWFKHHRIGR